MAVTISGTTGVKVPLGSVSAPGVSNTTDSTTGIYNPTSTSLAIATNGVTALTVNDSQALGFGSSPSYGTVGQAIISGGSGAAPTWGSVFSAATGDIFSAIGTTKSGYLLCDGSAYTRTSYTALAAAIGTPLAPIGTLSATTSFLAGTIYEANGLLLRTGSVATTTAVAANGLYTSTDGITWTTRTGMNIATYFGNNPVSYGASTYVALTQYTTDVLGTNNAYWMTSPDGVTWTARALGLGGNYHVSPVATAFGGTSNRHVMAVIYLSYSNTPANCGSQTAAYARLMYSADGITYTAADTNTYSGASYGWAAFDVAGYSGGFVSVAYLNNGTNYIKYSADGATWTDITSNVNSVAAINGTVSNVSYVNGRFIIQTSNGQIYTSLTGASGTWSQIVSANVSYNAKVRGNSNGYVMAIGTTSYTSQDLINWTSVPSILGLTVSITATPSTGSRFYGQRTANTNQIFSVDLFSYNTSTQFVVPKIQTSATGAISSPFVSNSVPVNYFIKT